MIAVNLRPWGDIVIGWAMLRMISFLCAFATFMALEPAVGWTSSMKVFATILTMAGASLLI